MQTRLFVIRQKGRNLFWTCSSEHGTGWNDGHPKQSFSPSELTREVRRLTDMDWFCDIEIEELQIPGHNEDKTCCEAGPVGSGQFTAGEGLPDMAKESLPEDPLLDGCGSDVDGLRIFGVRFPVGQTRWDGELRENQEIARRILLDAGRRPVVLPSGRDDHGNLLWDLILG